MRRDLPAYTCCTLIVNTVGKTLQRASAFGISAQLRLPNVRVARYLPHIRSSRHADELAGEKPRRYVRRKAAEAKDGGMIEVAKGDGKRRRAQFLYVVEMFVEATRRLWIPDRAGPANIGSGRTAIAINGILAVKWLSGIGGHPITFQSDRGAQAQFRQCRHTRRTWLVTIRAASLRH